jgi:hypothetical protein
LLIGDAPYCIQIHDVVSPPHFCFQSTAFCARALSQPDVIALLLHLLFHPESALGDVRSIAATEEEEPLSPLEVVANALAWAAMHSSGGCRDASLLSATDSGFPSDMLLQQHDPALTSGAAAAATDAAATRNEADTVYQNALALALTQWAKVCVASVVAW